MKRTGLLVAVALMSHVTDFAYGQEAKATDPTLCESVKSILLAAPKDQWPSTTSQVLRWDGGSSKCFSSADGKTLTCNLYSTQILSGCTLYKSPTAEQRAADSAARDYARTRLMPAIDACFAGSKAEPWQIQDDYRVVQGMKVSRSGAVPFRLGEGKSRVGGGNAMCGFEFVMFEIDTAP